MDIIGLASLVLLPFVIGCGILYLATKYRFTNRKIYTVLSVLGIGSVVVSLLIAFIIIMTISGMKAEGVI